MSLNNPNPGAEPPIGDPSALTPAGSELPPVDPSAAAGTTLPAAQGRRKLEATLVIGAVLVGLVVLTALVSFFWTPYDPTQAFPGDRLQGSSAQHLMGTDKFGRDTLSAIMYGARITLFVGVVAVGIALVIGTPIGILAGMLEIQWLSGLIMRANDLLLAFPALLLAIMFGAVFGANTTSAMVGIGIASVPAFARIARSGTLQVMSTEYILAAKASNRRPLRIASSHVLPNIAGMVVVQSSVAFALAVLAEAALSFLGLGTQPPTPSWGRMLLDSQQFLASNPMLAIWPGAAIALAVLGFNLLGDGLRDRFDPKMRGH
ncbi:ABC transporter permease [Saxibacter everestensis]|uniref:ABC transporter permease n=1 Tax=Saxibacter everestensis TaxID=2909229 RepID=A0ABY8QQX1_9MICO|nr:ABC transporter permease [Brevibacteriaceae bacterium ZFBP1038]